MKSLNRYLATLLLLIGLIVLTADYDGFDPEKQTESHQFVSGVEVSETTLEKAVDKEVSTQSQQEARQLPEYLAYQTEIFDYNSQNFGHYSASTSYSEYDFQTLELMAEQNNMLAANALGRKYLDPSLQESNIQKGIKWYKRAAALGSTTALDALSRLSFDRTLSEKEVLIRQLSYYQVIAYRGDRLLLDGARFLIDEKELTQEDIDLIHQQGNELYSQLEVEREKLGLPTFERSLPSYVEDYFNRVTTEIPLFATNPE